MTVERAFRTHYFDTTGEAYDASQAGYWRFAGGQDYQIEVADGDLMVVPSEGVYGFLYQAWPVAASTKTGHFHSLSEDAKFWEDQDNADKYTAVWQAAWSLSQMHENETEAVRAAQRSNH